MLSRSALASLLWNHLSQYLLQNLCRHCSSHSRNILRRVVLHEVCADNRTLNRVQMSNGLPHGHSSRLAMRDSRRKRRVEHIYVERNINRSIDLELVIRGKSPHLRDLDAESCRLFALVTVHLAHPTCTNCFPRCSAMMRANGQACDTRLPSNSSYKSGCASK